MRAHGRNLLGLVTLRAALALACVLISAPVAGQVLERGHEDEFSELLGSAPCPFLGASIEADHVIARYECGELRIVHRSRITDREAAAGGVVAGSFYVDGPERLRDVIALRFVDQDALWATPTPQHHEVRLLDRASPYVVGGLLVLMLLGFGPPSRRPHRQRWPLWIAMGLVTFSALAGPFGSSHEHHTFLGRIDCAATAGCFGDRPGWYAPIYSLYAPFVRGLPPTLAALTALSLGLTLLALWSMYEWVLAATDKPFAAGAAAILVALHPAIPRLAASLSLWPMALLLLFSALRLSLPPNDGYRRQVSAVAAWCLAWCSSAAFTTLIPLGVAATLAPKNSRRPWTFVFLGVCVAIAVAYAAPFAGEASAYAMAQAFVHQALFEPDIVPVGLALACGFGVWLSLRSPICRAWCLLFAPAFILGFPISVGYPTVFLHTFPLLFFYGAFAGLALSAAKTTRVRVLLLAAVLLSYLGAEESRSFANYDPPIRRELLWLHDTIPKLPPHTRLVLGPVLHDAMGGFTLEGDPVEVRYPRRLHQSQHHISILRFDEWLRDGSPIEGTLVYIGLAEQLFHPREREGTDVLIRPEAGSLLERFSWEVVAATAIETTCDPHIIVCAQTSVTYVRFLRPTQRVSGGDSDSR